MAQTSRTAYTDEEIAIYIREADCDTRSMLRALLGLPVRGRAGVRIARVLAARGIRPMVSGH